MFKPYQPSGEQSWLVLVNPAAGRGRGLRDWKQIAALLGKYHLPDRGVFTHSPGHATDITRQAIEQGHRNILVIGGDGTMNEVVNGVFRQRVCDTREICLGMISVGTGNDWGRMFRIPSDYEAAICSIRMKRTFLQDAGRVHYLRDGLPEDRYFINIAGMGFDAEVVRRTNRSKEKGRGGALLYLGHIFTSLFNYRYASAVISIDGRSVENEVFSMNVGIGRYSGGGMIQVPHAIADDGLFDMTVIRKISKTGVLLNLKRLYRGTIDKHPKVDTYSGRTIRIQSIHRILLETDGETLGHAPFEFSIIPRSVRVITGQDCT